MPYHAGGMKPKGKKKKKEERGQKIMAKGFFEKLNDMKCTTAKPNSKKSKPKPDKD